MDEKQLMERLNAHLASVRPLDQKAVTETETRWDTIAKPLKSLGVLEKNVTKLSGIAGTSRPRVKKRALIAMCADNGVIDEGVTQTGNSVTAIVARNMAEGSTTVTVMAQAAGVDVFPVDIGMATEGPLMEELPDEHTPVAPRTLLNRKLRRATRNLAKEPAMTKKEAREKACALLERVGLAHRLKHRAGELSGGEQQRAAIARSLMNAPELLLADEPTGNLDSVTGQGILDIFQELHANAGVTILMVTHDKFVAGLADRTVELKDGMLRAEPPPEG